MQERHRRGLLSKAEEVKLAELMAQMHVRGEKEGQGGKSKGKEDCVVM